MASPDVQRLEAERLRPSPKEPGAEERQQLLIRELIHVLACAMGAGRSLT